MTAPGRILLADDEDTFLRSTADLLQREGYHCVCVPDATAATNKLKKEEFDLLIADIRMPGNLDLQLVKEVPSIAERLPVILVTGYPSLQTAIASIQLPVVDYMVKPIELEQLLSHVEKAIARSRLSQTARNIGERLKGCEQDLQVMEAQIGANAAASDPVQVDAFMQLVFRNILGSVSDMMHLVQSLTGGESQEEPCHIMNCPRQKELTEAIRDTIDVLERTKGSFKSRELGGVRQRLEAILKRSAQ